MNIPLQSSLRASRAIAAGLGALLLLAGHTARAAGPQNVTIAQIVASPSTYDEVDVRIVGRVESAVPAGDESAFNLRDGAVKISVVSRSAAPTDGDRLELTGKVRVFGGAGEDADDPHDKFPPVLFETTRAPAP